MRTLLPLVVFVVVKEAACRPSFCKSSHLNCSAIDELSQRPQFPRLFPLSNEGGDDDDDVLATNERALASCKVAVIDAGLPRTGSTLLSLLVEDAMEQLTDVFGSGNYARRVVDLGYWRYDRHREGSYSWSISDIPEGTDIVTVKSHEYDSELARLCERSLVLLTSREPMAMAVSMRHAGWVNPNCDKIFSQILASEGRHRCWYRAANVPLVFEYEDVSRSKKAVVAAIASELAVALGIEDEAKNIKFSFGQNYRQKEANPGISGLRSSESEREASPSNLDRGENDKLQHDASEFLPEGCRNRTVWRKCFPVAWNRRLPHLPDPRRR